MAWIYLCIAGILEIFWAISLKHTEGFSNLRWSVVTIVGMTASFYFLAQALKTIPVGTAYCHLDRHRCGGHRCSWNCTIL